MIGAVHHRVEYQQLEVGDGMEARANGRHLQLDQVPAKSRGRGTLLGERLPKARQCGDRGGGPEAEHRLCDFSAFAGFHETRREAPGK
jgi:hypothetical protein